jgi:hypothetical protein
MYRRIVVFVSVYVSLYPRNLARPCGWMATPVGIGAMVAAASRERERKGIGVGRKLMNMRVTVGVHTYVTKEIRNERLGLCFL